MIGQNYMISDYTVMSDMRSYIKQIIITDNSLHMANSRSRVEGYIFAYNIILADDKLRIFAIVSCMLGCKAESCKWKHLTILTNRRIAINHNMAMQRNIISQFDLIAYYTIGPDLDVFSENSLF